MKLLPLFTLFLCITALNAYAKTKTITSPALGLSLVIPDSQNWSHYFSPWARDVEASYQKSIKNQKQPITRFNEKQLIKHFSLTSEYMLTPTYLEIKHRNSLGELSKLTVKIRELKSTSIRPKQLLEALLKALKLKIYKNLVMVSKKQATKTTHISGFKVACSKFRFSKYYNLKRKASMGKICLFNRKNFSYEVFYYHPTSEKSLRLEFEKVLKSIKVEP